jgi:radical SAM-linked protein
VKRAGVPIAFSQGFTPHPKISYASAAPTGTASEAEYLEIGLQREVDPAWVVGALDAALSPGLDVLDAVAAAGTSLADRIDASRWQVELPGLAPADVSAAVTKFRDSSEVLVERQTKQGRRTFDTRAAVASIEVITSGPAAPAPQGAESAAPSVSPGIGRSTAPEGPCAILDVVVRQVTPSVRPDDVLAGLRVVADLEPPVPPRATRLAQGRLTAQGAIADPLEADRDGAVVGER